MRIFTSINSGIDADGPHAGGITITITIIIFTTITRGPNVDVTKAMSTLKKPNKSKPIKNRTAIYTVFENHRKSLIQHCERSELSLYFE